MQSGEIPDSALTASSYLPDRGPSSARYVVVSGHWTGWPVDRTLTVPGD